LRFSGPRLAPPGCIFIVDDDADLRETIREVLDDEGYPTAAAANGVEALAYLRSSPAPSLILLDLMMPLMDGWRFREEQLRDPRLADIPVIVMTAGRKVMESSALQDVPVISKPVRLETLLETVRRYLP
jgi:CheY-like chemotaxis protein